MLITLYFFKLAVYMKNQIIKGYLTLCILAVSFTAFAQPLSGIKTVGPGASASYSSLTLALRDVKLKGYTGLLHLQLQSGYSSSAEVFPLLLNDSLNRGPGDSILIYPEAGALVNITANVRPSIFRFDGGRRIIIDGRAGLSGPAALTIQNNDTVGGCISFVNAATGNRISYVNISGSIGTDTFGLVAFGHSTKIHGNDSNTISFCNLRSGLRPATRLISGKGSTARPNAANIIFNNNLCDFGNVKFIEACGISITNNNTRWIIDQNSFYHSVSPFTSNGFLYAVKINTPGSLFTVSNNYIGGTAPQCGGTKCAYNAGFFPVNVSADTVFITGNTISKMSQNTTALLSMIMMDNGRAFIHGNIIGSGTLNNIIEVNTTLYGIYLTNLCKDSSEVRGNTVGGITFNGSATMNFVGVLAGTDKGILVEDNLIGSESQANSILNNAAGSMHGVDVKPYSVGRVDVIRNTIANITLMSTSGSTSNEMQGIWMAGSYGGPATANIRGNRIHHLSNYSTGSSDLIGSHPDFNAIVVTCNPYRIAIDSNTIYAICYKTPAARLHVRGIFYRDPTKDYIQETAFGAAKKCMISNNLIHDLSVPVGSSAFPEVSGIMIWSGANTIYNNIIRLGIRSNGTHDQALANFYGVYLIQKNGSFLYHNTIYIGGSSGSTNDISAAVAYTSSTAGIANDTIMNNVFVAARSIGSTLMNNYPIYFSSLTAGPNIDYNIEYATLSHGSHGSHGTDISPRFKNPEGDSAHLDFSFDTSVVEGTGLRINLVERDREGRMRNQFTPTDRGAIAANGFMVDFMKPEGTYTPLNNTSLLSKRTLFVRLTDVGNGILSTGPNAPKLSYQRSAPTSSSSYNAYGVLVSGTLNDGMWKFELDYTQIGVTPVLNDQYSYTVSCSDSNAVRNTYSSGGVYKIVPGLSGTLYVGTGQTYTSLTNTGGICAYINNGALTGNLDIVVKSDLTTESGTFGFNFIPEDGAGNYSITVKLDSTVVRNINLSNTANGQNLINLNGCNRIIFDGEYNSVPGKLVLRNNSSIAGKVVMFKGNVKGCIFRNCSFSSNNQVMISCDINQKGFTYDSITLYNNRIESASPMQTSQALIYFHPGPLIEHLNITDNDFVNLKGTGILMDGTMLYSCRISGNNFYQTINSTYTGENTAVMLNLPAESGNNMVSGNYIGGSAKKCAGSRMRIGNFAGIQLTNAGIDNTRITGNTIANLQPYNANSSFTTRYFHFSGIQVAAGNALVEDNTVGDLNNDNSIQVTDASIVVDGITVNGATNVESTGNVVVRNNTVSGIALTSSVWGYRGINVSGGDSVLVDSNRVGNMMRMSGLTSSGPIYAIDNNAAKYCVISNNDIGGIKGNSWLRGIIATKGANLIRNNRIMNLLTFVSSADSNADASLIGIVLSCYEEKPSEISGNRINNLLNNCSSADYDQWNGFGYRDPAMTGILCYTNNKQVTRIHANFVHDLYLLPSVPGFSAKPAVLTGIKLVGGRIDVTNNMVRLGLDSNGNSINRHSKFCGITDWADSANTFAGNSVYIGGTALDMPGTAACESYAFSRKTTGKDSVVNNIFINERTGVGFNSRNEVMDISSLTNLYSDYNIMKAAGSRFVRYNFTDYAHLAAWREVSGKDLHSLSVDPRFKNIAGNYKLVDMHLKDSTPAEQSGFSFNNNALDFDNEQRSLLSPTDIGADAVNGIYQDTSGPAILQLPLADFGFIGSRTFTCNILDSTDIPTHGLLKPRVYYRKNGGNWFNTAGTLSNGTSKNGNWQFKIDTLNTKAFKMGDTVYYIVIAQDQGARFNISSNAVLTATDVNTITLFPANPPYYRIVDTLSPSITYTPIPNSAVRSSKSLIALISDSTLVQTAIPKFLPKIYFKKGVSGSYKKMNGIQVSGTTKTGSWRFDLPVDSVGGVLQGDTIFYYVIAQDTSFNMRSNPTGVVAVNADSVITHPTPRFFFYIRDFVPPVITYTKPSNAPNAAGFSLTASITDSLFVPRTGPNVPRLQFKRGKNGTYYSKAGMLISDSAYTSKWIFATDTSLTGGMNILDTMYYYVIAQDSAPIANVGSNPSGVSATSVHTIASPPSSPNAYIRTDTTTTKIEFTLLADSFAGNRTLRTSIYDSTGIIAPKLYFKRNGSGSYQSTTGTLVSGTNKGGQWNFSLTSSLLTGLKAYDTVHYYVITQSAGVPFKIASSPAGVVATNINAIITHPQAVYYKVQDTLAPVLLMIPLADSSASGNRHFTASVSDSEGIDHAAFKPVVYFKKGVNGAVQKTQGTFNSGTTKNELWNFRIDESTIAPALNDTIYYCIAAQNAAAISKVGSYPAGINATDVNTVVSYPNFLYYRIDASVTNPVIVLSTLADSLPGASRLLVAQITDSNRIDTGSYGPTVYFRRNTGSFASAKGVLTTGNTINGTWHFIINQVGLAASDTVSYFVIAQNKMPAPRLTSNPKGVTAADVNSIFLPPPLLHSYTILTTTGIGEMAGGDWLIYPNPTNGMVTIEQGGALTSTVRVCVSTVEGKMVYETHHPIGEPQFVVDLSEVQNGIYFLTLYGPGGSSVHKLVITGR